MLPASQIGLTVLGVSMVVAGFTGILASILSIQVKRGFEELYYQQSAARGFVNLVAPDPLALARADRAAQALPRPAEPVQRPSLQPHA
jgi:hypothetical protein